MITVPQRNLRITIKSIIKNSEFDARLTSPNIYWEGVKVKGSHTVQALWNYMVIKTNSMNSRCLCR